MGTPIDTFIVLLEMVNCQLPFGTPYQIRLPVEIDGFQDRLIFYHSPEGSGLDLLLSISRKSVCLWSAHVILQSSLAMFD